MVTYNSPSVQSGCLASGEEQNPLARLATAPTPRNPKAYAGLLRPGLHRRVSNSRRSEWLSMPRSFSSPRSPVGWWRHHLIILDTGARSRDSDWRAGKWPAQRRTALPARLSAAAPFEVPQLHAAAPGHAQRLPGAPGDRLPLLLCHQRHDPDGEVVRLRQVHRREPHPAVAQRQQEGGIPRPRSSFGDGERRPR